MAGNMVAGLRCLVPAESLALHRNDHSDYTPEAFRAADRFPHEIPLAAPIQQGRLEQQGYSG